MDKHKIFHSGFVTVIGCPNVGKSTLVNALVGEKIAIVSDKPQTTRNRIMGVSTSDDCQMVFLDTPGFHTPRNKLGRFMVKSIKDAMDGMDALVVMVDAVSVRNRDHAIIQDALRRQVPVFLVINKIDLVEKTNLLALVKSLENELFSGVFLISALLQDGVDDLKKALAAKMPEGPRYFPDDMITDQPERVMCAEIVREKALLNLREEVPHGIGVEMMGITEINVGLQEIDATIYCERDSHKRILVGKGGEMIKKIGTQARGDIERLLGVHVNLKLFVKVRPGWRDRQDDLKTLGYEK